MQIFITAVILSKSIDVKGTMSREFKAPFFYESIVPGRLIVTLKYF
jgi:hypothetical protein